MADFEYLLDDKLLDCHVEKKGSTIHATVGDQTYEIEPVGNELYRVVVNGTNKLVAVSTQNGTTYIDIDSNLIELTEPSQDGFAGGSGDHGGDKDKIFAPMPGKIVKLLVAVGDQVKPKQQVVIVEAMKMENPVLCRAAGIVKAINFEAGDQVDTDSPIVELDLDH